MKDCEINSKALIRNLECSLEQLKNGVPIEEALNEGMLKFGYMHMDERDKVRDLIEPKLTPKGERMLDRIIRKYGNRS